MFTIRGIGMNENTEKQNLESMSANPNNATYEWLVVGGSAIGRRHRLDGTVCQDSFAYDDLGNGWGIAIVSDGAGSRPRSELGSHFLAHNAAKNTFSNLVITNAWNTTNSPPSQSEWALLARSAWKEIWDKLDEFAKSNNLRCYDLGATISVVIFSPSMILATHIGDTRSAYRNNNKQWKALTSPIKGEEYNSTIFLSDIDWKNDTSLYIESNVIVEPITAFAVMTDGLEMHSFLCSIIDENGMWHDPNEPYPGFFDPLVEWILSLHKQQLTKAEMEEKWEQFLANGTESLKNEDDDKTLVMGVLVEKDQDNNMINIDISEKISD